MSDDLKALMKSALADYERAGVDGSEGARAMRGAINHIEELEAKLEQAAEIMSIYCDPMNMEPEHEQFLYDLNKEFP